MYGRRSLIGLCLLCAIALAGFGAQNAAAAVKGTTMFTCKQVAHNTGFFTKAHCKNADKGTGDYSHFEVAQDTPTEVRTTNAGLGPETNTTILTRVHSVVSGVSVEFESTTGSGTGTLTNIKDAATGEHIVAGFGTLTHDGMSVVKPAGKGCKVKGGKAVTNELALTTKGQGDNLKIEPASGTTIEKFEVEGCTGSKALEALNGVYEMTGSYTGPLDGATLSFTAAATTAQGTLKLRGQVAGIDGTTTIEGRDNNLEAFTPLSFTTVETAP